MITQARAYAYLASETDLPHDIRMDIIEALFSEYAGDEREGYKLTGQTERRGTPLYEMMDKPSSIARGFKMMALGGDLDMGDFNETLDSSIFEAGL
jgi:hypothetical protein